MQSKTKKVVAVCVGAPLLAFAVVFLFFRSSITTSYDSWRFNNTLHGAVIALSDFEKKDYFSAMSDTYGGKTPQETLQMYTDALDKGDYSLASKYFISANQKNELEGFLNADESKKPAYMAILKKLSPGRNNTGGDEYYMQADLDGPDFYARFRQYPNGVWKIIEI